MHEYTFKKIIKCFPRDFAIRMRVLDALNQNKRPSTLLDEIALVRKKPYQLTVPIVELYEGMAEAITLNEA